jgi:acetolactate synthase-1/2/3 large subunit
MPFGLVNSDSLGQFLGACLPENAIVVDEAVSTGRGFFKPTEHARAHDWLNSMGSSLGYALPVAIGCAIAKPDRPVIALVGDGSAMFSVQALWTMARENLNIKVLIFANHAYKILKNELVSVGLESPTQTALSMLTLNSPTLDWVSMAKAHGVEGFKVDSIEALVKTFNHCLTQTGTQLIQIEM